MMTLIILISECEEYMREIAGTTNVAPLVGTSSDVIEVENDCGTVNHLVVGGTETAINEFPHMVALGRRTSSGEFTLMCGGTLISHTWVLSAAHCTYGPKYIFVIFSFSLSCIKISTKVVLCFFISVH